MKDIFIKCHAGLPTLNSFFYGRNFLKLHDNPFKMAGIDLHV